MAGIKSAKTLWDGLSEEERKAVHEEIKALVAEDIFHGALNRGAAALTGFTLLALIAYAAVMRLPEWVQSLLNMILG